MKAIEAMAKAYISAGISPKYWDGLSTPNRLAIAANMRTALLALAEAEIPDDIAWIGIDAYDNAATGPHLLEKGFSEGFRAMLRALAKEAGE